MQEREGQDPEQEFTDEEQETIVLTDEEGHEHEFTLIQTLTVDDKDYAILLPTEVEDEEEEAAVILRIDEDENGEDILVEIEDEAEFERVADAWEQLLDEEDADAEDEEDR